MSADNFVLIRRWKDGFAVTNENASADEEDEETVPDAVAGGRAVLFDSHYNALRFATAEHAEYGVIDRSGYGNVADSAPRTSDWLDA